jgi:hypothetical protein
MATQLPSRRNNSGLNRRNANSAPSRRNVPNVGASQDPGVRVPNNLFASADQQGATGQALMGVSDSLFKVQNKLKKREDDRFLLEAEDELNSGFGKLTTEYREGLDLSDPNQVKGVNEKTAKFIEGVTEKATKLSPDAHLRYEHILSKKHTEFSVNLAKEITALTHQKDLNRIFGVADQLGNNPAGIEVGISESYLNFDQTFDSRFASLIDEQDEPEIKRQGKLRILTKQMDSLMLEGDGDNLSIAKKFLDDPETLALQYNTDAYQSLDSKVATKLNSYRTRIKGIEDGRSDVKKRQIELPNLIKNGFIKTKDEQRAYVFTGKMPEKTNEQKTIRGYEEAIKANTDANGYIDPKKKKFIDEVFKVNQDSEYEKKRKALEQWNEDHKNASPDQQAMAESTIMNMPIAPEIQGRNEVAKAEEIAKAASGASTFMLQKLGLTPEPDKAEEIKKVEAGIKVYEDKFGPLDDKAKKRLYKEKLGLKEIELSPIDQFFKDVENLRERKIPIDNADVELVARQKLGLPLSEAEKKQAIEIEAILNSFKTVQEAVGVAEGVEKITDPKVKDIVKQKLDLDVPPEKQNKVEKLISRINTGKKAGVILSDADEKLLIKKEIGDIPLTKEEKEKEAKLKGKLEGITEKAKDEEVGDSIETGVEGKDSKKMNTLIVQRLGGEVNALSGTVTLSPEKTKVALAVLVKAENFYGTKKADSLGQAVEMAFNETKIPETKAATTIADEVINNAERETPLATGEELENAPTRLEKIKLEDATGLPSAGINIWNSTFGQISEGLIAKDVVRGRQKLALLEGDFIAAFKRSPRLPVWEQQRLANIFSGPEAWTSAGEVREAMKDVDVMLTEEITFQRSLLDNENMPFKEKREALKNISTLARFRKRIREFELDPLAKFKNVKSIKNVSKDEIKMFRAELGKDGIQNFKQQNPAQWKAINTKWLEVTGNSTQIKEVGKKKNQNPLEAFRNENNIEVTEGKGEGFAEVLFSDSDGNGRNIIEFRKSGKFSKEDIVNAETLHFMGGSKKDGTPYHEEFFDLKQQFINAMPEDSKKFAERKFAQAKKKGMTGTNFSNFENYIQNVWSDLELRGAMFPQLMTDPKERKLFKSRKIFTPEQKAILKQMDKIVKGE